MKPYLQTTPYTTAASSLLAVLHYFKPEIKLTKEEEFRIWKETALLPTRASSIFGLANYAQKKGLNVKVVLEKIDYEFPDYRFYRYTKKDMEQAAFSSELYLKEAKENNLVIEVRKITLENIKKELRDSVLLLRLNSKIIRKTKKNTSNFLVVYGYHRKYFQIIDPALGALSVPEEVLEMSLETLKTKKYRNRAKLIFKRDATARI